MNDKNSTLGEFEELILLAVAGLGENAYGVSILKRLEMVAGKKTTVGALYATLDRLERKGFISSRTGEATAERGRREKRYFRIEGAGVNALEQAERRRSSLRQGLRLHPEVGGI